ncbi:glycosyltransferase family protein [Gluconacetobacter takamatsuzukensis]|uniref:Glycosyltransferase family protein n=2 Tax=Gluconacetobacter takamatsuzukensis TaxID=1286190 RepID=A0A7W4KB25_9PROT|nr:glycosyltransferase family protein [Gluconacetobacter takamatsuzukensis]
MSRVGDMLFAARQEVEAVRLVLEVASRYLDDGRFSLAAAMAILRYTVRYDIAESLLRNALRCQADNIQAQAFLAHVRMARGDVADGCALFSGMMRRYPDERAAICEYMSTSLLQVGYPMESLKILQSYLETGQATALLLKNVGCALLCVNRSAEAIPWYERAVALDAAGAAAAQSEYACALLKAGRLGEGWALYARRGLFERNLIAGDRAAWFLALPRLRPGDEVAGRRIILFQEQGLGDTLQFIRFVPDLLAKGAAVTILVPRTLVRLLAQSCPGASVREARSFAREEGYDYILPIPDLPHIAGVMSERDIPAPASYLRADPGDVARFAALLPERRPRIGVVWAGERRMQSAPALLDQRRSTTLAALGAAVTPVDATLVSLQFGGPRGELAGWTGQALCDPMDAVRDMADTAAIMANLDLVISVDTSPVHLAGAVGCPVWMISREDACWRWGDSGERSAWYPGMRLFRARERSLVPALQEVGAALQIWVKQWHPS